MKKRFAFILCLIVALSLLLTACNNTATSVSIRWNDDEEFLFNIELADFNTAPGATTYFNTYRNENDEKDNNTYYKDSLISSTEASNFLTTKQLRPIAAKGTLKITNKRSSEDSANREFTMEQEIYVQYLTETLNNLDPEVLTILQGVTVSATDAQNPFDEHEGKTTFKSVSKNSVTFVNDQNQKPIKSSSEVDGFYVGQIDPQKTKEEQYVSKYSISTVYDFDNRVAKVTTKNADGKEEVKDNKLGVSKGGYCLDANQILLYVRSLGKTDSDFNDTPTKQVYDPYYNNLTSATFALNREFNVVLNNEGNNVCVKLNAVVVVVDNSPFMYQINIPNLSAKSLDVGAAVTSSEKPPKYTTVRFRVGNFSYELASYEDYQQVLNALTTTEESK